MAALCPYTGSATTSGVGLAAEGVSPAPIRYGVDGGGGELAGLMRSFWAETEGMLRAGQAGCSSIVLSAPCWALPCQAGLAATWPIRTGTEGTSSV